MFGFGLATVNDKLQLQNVEVYYNAEDFINVLRGNKKVEEVNSNWKAGGCPFHEMNKAAKKEGIVSKVRNLFSADKKKSGSLV